MVTDGQDFAGVVFYSLLFGAPWAGGRLIRLGRQRQALLERQAVLLEEQRDEQARAAVADERARIARELHDVVAHAISVVVLQARGGRKLLGREPEAAREAFDAIERTGAQALGEMRRLLGLLRDDDEDRARAAADARPARRSSPSELARRRPARRGAPSTASRARCRRASTCPPTGSSRRRSPTRSSTPAPARAPCPRRATSEDAVVVEVTDDGAGAARARATGGRPRARRHARAGRDLRRRARRRAAARGRLRRARAAAVRGRRDDPRPARRRPGAGARRLPHDPRRRAGHRGRRRGGRRRARRSRWRARAASPTSS